MCQLTIEYLNQLEKHQRLFPSFIYSKNKFFFEKAPEQMIEIIRLIASNQPGRIQFDFYYFISFLLFRYN
jgi:hypothetical protein